MEVSTHPHPHPHTPSTCTHPHTLYSTYTHTPTHRFQAMEDNLCGISVLLVGIKDSDITNILEGGTYIIIHVTCTWIRSVSILTSISQSQTCKTNTTSRLQPFHALILAHIIELCDGNRQLAVPYTRACNARQK